MIEGKGDYANNNYIINFLFPRLTLRSKNQTVITSLVHAEQVILQAVSDAKQAALVEERPNKRVFHSCISLWKQKVIYDYLLICEVPLKDL